MALFSRLSRNISCDTPCSVEELVARLKPRVDAAKSIRGGIFSGSDYRRYQGQINNDQFRLCRIVRGRNIVTPIISGQLIPTGSGTRVEAIVHLRKRTWSVLIFTTVFLLVGSILSFMGYLEGTNKGTMPYLSGPLFLVAVFLVLQTMVKNESEAFLKVLKRLS